MLYAKSLRFGDWFYDIIGSFFIANEWLKYKTHLRFITNKVFLFSVVPESFKETIKEI